MREETSLAMRFMKIRVTADSEKFQIRSMPRTSGPGDSSVGDLNADGYQDVFITSSMNFPFRYQVNSLLLNDRGRKFRDAEFILGVEPRRDRRTATPWYEGDCSYPKYANSRMCEGRTGRVRLWAAIGSRSSVIFDLDHDGDLDIVTNDFHSQPLVLISNLSRAANPKCDILSFNCRGLVRIGRGWVRRFR